MYVETLKHFDIFELFPHLNRYYNILFNNDDDQNIIFNTLNNDYTFLFEQIIQRKYKENPLKTIAYKENPYQYNEFTYVLDCNEWNVIDLYEFIVEYSNLKSITMKPNLFILFNIENLDRTTQNVIGTLLEKSYKTARYWLISNHINKILNKLINRCFYITVFQPTNQHLKHMLFKIYNKPIFEIMIDKICEKSNGDYGTALLYLDMLAIDSSVLNRNLFSQELNEITQFIKDQKYTSQNYPKLREICFKLLEKTDVLDILHIFLNYFLKIFPIKKYGWVVSRCAHYQLLDKIPNKQVWLLESWFLDSYLIYWDKMVLS